MSQWYVKDLSQITGVSKQTLHHYDQIGLLKPSLRLANGYRLYSEADLLKLQQIIALKFFGFSLQHIKKFLTGHVDPWDHFLKQAECLKEQAKNLMEAAETLGKIVTEKPSNKSIPWKTILQLIEVYKMTHTLEKTWAGRVFDPDELKQYATFESGLKKRFSPDDKKDFETSWAAHVATIEAHLHEDPHGPIGLTIAKDVMGMINGLYGKEHANLKHSIWEKGFKKGQMDGDHYTKPAVVEWLDKAIDGYYRGRIYGLLDQIEMKATETLSHQWQALLEEMYGDSESLKQDLIKVTQSDPKVGPIARQWLLSK